MLCEEGGGGGHEMRESLTCSQQGIPGDSCRLVIVAIDTTSGAGYGKVGARHPSMNATAAATTISFPPASSASMGVWPPKDRRGVVKNCHLLGPER